jgi:hypothetical protein
MKIIWTLESLKGKNFFLHELDLICLVTSVANWKKLYPQDQRILYCDSSVYRYLNQLDLLDLWTSVDTEILDSKDLINRAPFWAASKIKVIRNIEAPFIIIDCDFYPKRKFLDNLNLEEIDIVVNEIEQGILTYPGKRDPLVQDMILKYPVKFGWKTNYAFNVSFLYIGNERLRKTYTNVSYEWMEILSKDAPNQPLMNGRYMIFCEQKVLKEVCDLEEVKVHLLSGKMFMSDDNKYIGVPLGYQSLNLNDSDYIHLQHKKRIAKENPSIFQDVKSGIINSIIDLNSFDPKDLFYVIKENQSILNLIL